MSNVRIPTDWELSHAYESTNVAARHHVSSLLAEWGSTNYNAWPEGARFVRMDTSSPELPLRFARLLVSIGQRHISRQIPSYKLERLFPRYPWPAGSIDVLFYEPTHGNVRYNHAKELKGLMLLDHLDLIRIVHLGCDHPNKSMVRRGTYTEWTCLGCGHTWGVDRSD